MDKKILDLHILLKSHKYKNSFFDLPSKIVTFRMLSYEDVRNYIDIFYKLHQQGFIYIKQITID